MNSYTLLTICNIYIVKPFYFFQPKLKSKRKKSWALHSDKTGRRILGIIQSETIHRRGITEKEIRNRLNLQLNKGSELTKQDVYYHLRKASKNNQLFKDKMYYYLTQSYVTDDDWSIFSEFLHECQRKNGLFDLMPNPSPISWPGNSLEYVLMQFSQKLGAIITYILMESLRPTKELMNIKERTRFFLNFINEAVSFADILVTFSSSLPMNITAAHRIPPELQESALEELTIAYRNVYPHVYRMIEEGYKTYTTIEDLGDCMHQWRRIDIHKIGKRYECKKCKTISIKRLGKKDANH